MSCGPSRMNAEKKLKGRPAAGSQSPERTACSSRPGEDMVASMSSRSTSWEGVQVGGLEGGGLRRAMHAHLDPDTSKHVGRPRRVVIAHAAAHADEALPSLRTGQQPSPPSCFLSAALGAPGSGPGWQTRRRRHVAPAAPASDAHLQFPDTCVGGAVCVWVACVWLGGVRTGALGMPLPWLSMDDASGGSTWPAMNLGASQVQSPYAVKPWRGPRARPRRCNSGHKRSRGLSLI